MISISEIALLNSQLKDLILRFRDENHDIIFHKTLSTQIPIKRIDEIQRWLNRVDRAFYAPYSKSRLSRRRKP